MKNAPCYGCRNRYPECHGKYQNYLDYKAKNDAIRTKRRAEQGKTHKFWRLYYKEFRKQYGKRFTT